MKTWWGKKEERTREESTRPSSDDQNLIGQDCLECAKLPPEIDRSITSYREQIKKIIHNAQKISIREVLAIGNSVNSIVTHTRTFIAAAKSSLEATFSKQSETLENYITDSRKTAEIQSETVERALLLSNDISVAGEAVDKLARQAKLLALNATIEAARLGSAGSAFGVISDEMNHLSDEISKANRLIESSSKAIRTNLPTIMQQTKGQIKKIEEFTTTMSALKDSIEQSISITGNEGDNQLNTILDLSYSAMSHLQFQDPMVQDLEKVNTVLQKCHKDLNTRLGLPFTEKSIWVNTDHLEIDKNGQNADSTSDDVERRDLDAESPETKQEAGDVLLF